MNPVLSPSSTEAEFFIKVVGRTGPEFPIDGSLPMELMQYLSDYPQAVYTIGLRFAGLPSNCHMTVSFIGSPSSNPSFHACLSSLRATCANTTIFPVMMSWRGICNFGDLPVALVSLDDATFRVCQSMNQFGIREGPSHIRLFHITLRTFPDSPTEFVDFVENLQSVVPIASETVFLAESLARWNDLVWTAFEYLRRTGL